MMKSWTEVHAIKDAIGVKYANNLDALFNEIQCVEVKGRWYPSLTTAHLRDQFTYSSIAADTL
jgi:hypothetical protein